MGKYDVSYNLQPDPILIQDQKFEQLVINPKL